MWREFLKLIMWHSNRKTNYFSTLKWKPLYSENIVYTYFGYFFVSGWAEQTRVLSDSNFNLSFLSKRTYSRQILSFFGIRWNVIPVEFLKLFVHKGTQQLMCLGINIEYYMESARVRCLHTSVAYQKSNKWAKRTSEISDTKQRVCKHRTKHFPCGIMFVIYILSPCSHGLLFWVSFALIVSIFESTQTVCRWKYSLGNCFSLNAVRRLPRDFSSLTAHILLHLYVWFC